MAFGFNSFGHFVASVAHDIVSVAKKLAPVAERLAASEGTVEAITSLIDPQAVLIERSAYALLGKAMDAVHVAGSITAAASGGSNALPITLTAEEINELAGLYTTFKKLAQTHSLTAALAAPAPKAA